MEIERKDAMTFRERLETAIIAISIIVCIVVGVFVAVTW